MFDVGSNWSAIDREVPRTTAPTKAQAESQTRKEHTHKLPPSLLGIAQPHKATKVTHQNDHVDTAAIITEC